MRVEIRDGEQTLWHTQVTLEPGESWQETLAESWPQRLTMAVLASDGTPLLHYEEHIPEATPLPNAASAPKLPQELHNPEELYFIGQHIEQYNHASRSAEDYYRRAIELDPEDYRNNVALGNLALNRADWLMAQRCAEAALARAHRLNKNPRDGEASLLLGAAFERQGEVSKAWDSYYKASWSGNCRDAAFYSLARLAMARGDEADALAKVELSLQFNASNNLAMALKALALATTQSQRAALTYIDQALKTHPLSYALHYARWAISGDAASGDALRQVTGDEVLTPVRWRGGWYRWVKSRRLANCWRCWTVRRRCRCSGKLRSAIIRSHIYLMPSAVLPNASASLIRSMKW